MKYDYTFFKDFAAKKRTLRGLSADGAFYGYLFDLYGSEEEVYKHYEILFRPADQKDYIFNQPTIVRGNGAYYKGGQSVSPLEASLKTTLPEDFVQFYEQFGECAIIIIRDTPVWIYPLQQMIDTFEDDPDIEIEEGRFFRFGQHYEELHIGLRRHDETDEWQVVVCTYGLLYSEMIGPMGRETVVAPSFYEWLKRIVVTDGYPDEAHQGGEYLDIDGE